VGGAATGGQPTTTGGAGPDGCGNGTVEAWEGCDPMPHDNNLGDGCTPLCKVEPDCPSGGGGCTTRCGDGFVLGDETCDDGNTAAGDGCSPTCQAEANFDCVEPALGSTVVVPMIVRDFLTGGDFEKGNSFATGLSYANQGLLKPILNDKGKPELASTTGTYNGTAAKPSGIASAESFAQWYDDGSASSGVNSYNATVATGLILYGTAGSTYVNRWGANGERWTRESGKHWCGQQGQEVKDTNGNPIPCSYCPADDPVTPECDNPYPVDCDDHRADLVRCEVESGTGTYFGHYIDAQFDGTPVFFPADSLTPASPSATAQIPGYFDPAWPTEVGGAKHNFSFTTEVRFWFKYDAKQTLRLSFIGDDDAWVFVNKKLAIDAGGIHTPVGGTLVVATDGTVTATVTPTGTTTGPAIVSNPVLGLEDGHLYEVAIFQAERQTFSSSYALGFNGFNSAPSVCTHR
jgi:fibro-slime domain-containing protein